MIARDIMNEDVITVSIPGSRDEVLDVLKEHGISGVPVLKDGTLVGIITRKDILNNPEEEQIALLMTRNPIVVDPNVDITEVVEVLIKSNIRRIPVVEDSKLVGIITVADVVKAMAEMDIDKRAGDFISEYTCPVWEETPLNVIVEIMRLGRSEALPVLDSRGKLSGIIDEKGIINLISLEDLVEKSDYSQAGGDDEWTWEGLRDYTRKYFEVTVIRLPDEPVKNVMSEAVSVYPQVSVVECAKKMVKTKIDYLAVITPEENLLGLLFDRNLIRAIL